MPNQMLRATPYLVPDDERSNDEFSRVAARSAQVAARAVEVRRQIGQEATELLQPFLRAQRSELVAQSNQIEGNAVSRRQVLEAVASHRELLDGEVHGLLEAMRADPQIVNALGLYKAQEIADEWAHSGQRPRAFELRQLHALLTADDRIGGHFRTRDVAIGGTSFRPPAHYDVPKAMDEFASWWTTSTGDPVLDATVAHAWLTHVHPYEDGNGRLARVLANFALAQASYPPLVIRADTDRGQYYDALAASDDGNVLPLYALFARVIRRTVRIMSSPGYTRDFLEDRLLASVEDQRSAWCALTTSFADSLASELALRNWSLEPQGLPDRASFQLLAERDADGNSWFAIIRDETGVRRSLLWFGFGSRDLLDLTGKDRTGYPSVFVSVRDKSPGALHPFTQIQAPGLPDEVFIKPLDPSPIYWREGFDLRGWTVHEGARGLATALSEQP